MTPAERRYLHEPAYTEQCRRAIVEVAQETGYAVADLTGHCRERALVRARWLAMRIAHNAGVSKAQIGREFNVHHTSVIHGLRRIEEEMSL